MIGICLTFSLLLAAEEPVSGASVEEKPIRPLFLATTEGRGRHHDTIEAGLAFIAQRQQESGAIGKSYTVAVTSLSGLAFLGAGYGYERGRYGRNVGLCVKYLLQVSQSHSSPGFLSGPNETHQMHSHGYAMLFLTQVYGELPTRLQRRVKVLIQRGIEILAAARSFQGGWYYGPRNDEGRDENSVTVCVLQALRAARNVGFAVDLDLITGAKAYLELCQKENGSFKYSISVRNQDWSTYELTCGAVASLHALGSYDSDHVRNGLDFLKRCLSKTEEKPLDAAMRYRFYGNFYAAQCYHQIGGAVWRTWYPVALGQLVAEREEQGGSWYWTSRYGDEYATAMALLTLEVPLRYLPIFQR